MSQQLTWSHYCELLSLENINKIQYYINLSIEQTLSVRDLRNKIKNKEYERLTEETKNKLIVKGQSTINDFLKNAILIKNSYNYQEISKKVLKQLMLEDLDNFLTELQKEHIGQIQAYMNYIDKNIKKYFKIKK